jgi:hypothetical protein
MKTYVSPNGDWKPAPTETFWNEIAGEEQTRPRPSYRDVERDAVRSMYQPVPPYGGRPPVYVPHRQLAGLDDDRQPSSKLMKVFVVVVGLIAVAVVWRMLEHLVYASQ